MLPLYEPHLTPKDTAVLYTKYITAAANAISPAMIITLQSFFAADSFIRLKTSIPMIPTAISPIYTGCFRKKADSPSIIALFSAKAGWIATSIEASPYITEKKLLKITLDGDSGAADIIEKSIQLLDKVPTDLSGLCIAFDKGEHSLQETCRELETLEKNCEARLKEIQTIRSATVMPILELLTDYQQKISTFLKEHDTIEEKMMSGALKRLQLSVITDYILFFDQE